MKRIIRISALMLALCITTLSFTACGNLFKPKYCKGLGYTFTPSEIMIGVGSDKRVFPEDAVDLQLFYALYYTEAGSYDPNDPLRDYRHEEGDTIFFGLYLCGNGLDYIERYFDKPVDYTNIDHCSLVKTISQEEASIPEYGYSMSYLADMINYGHSEVLHIPKEFFQYRGGFFAIDICVFRIPKGTNESYFVNAGKTLQITYEALNDGTVRIGIY